MFLSGRLSVIYDTIGKGRSVVTSLAYQLATQKLGYEPECRNCWFAKCGKVYAF